MNKEIKEFLEKALEVLSWCQENADEKWMVDHLMAVRIDLDQALALSKQPKCKTCGDRRKIQNPEYQPPRFLDECETYTTPSSIPCPDCQQPTQQECDAAMVEG